MLVVVAYQLRDPHRRRCWRDRCDSCRASGGYLRSPCGPGNDGVPLCPAHRSPAPR
jgi:hypothetical protein